MSLHDEGRGGDVGEQHALGETHLQDVGHVAAVAEHGAETAENVAPGYGAAAFGRERLAEAETTCEQDASQHQQDAEDALPADRVGEGAADDGGDDRSHAVDGADQRQHPGQVAADREMTMPPEPAMPCRKRAVTNWRMSEAKMQSRVEPMKSHMAVSSGVRRPYLSLRGPKSSCPAARPIMLVVSPICTIDEEVWKKSVMAGSVGRYISVTNGPNAVSRPSRTSR